MDDRYNSSYIYHSICNVFDDFRRKYFTTINLQFGALKHLKFCVHDDRRTQDSIATELDLRQMEIEREQQQLEAWRNVKKYFLENMFA
ncbi:MAG: hypothetical protein LIO74_04195 [Ruminococcus sp.]|nr:hypothetical protein [Ruminococcus sp.]